MRTDFSNKKTAIIYFGLIIAIAFFAIAYFSSYSAMKQGKYASEFDILRTEDDLLDSSFELIDVSDSAAKHEADGEEELVVTPIGIGRIPSIEDASAPEIKIYNILQKNDGAISEAEKEMLTGNLHWQEYIAAPGENLSDIAKDFETTAAAIRKANCLPDKIETLSKEKLLYIPDSADDIEATHKYVAEQLAEEAKILRDKKAREAKELREKNKMHPLLYVVQKGDTAAKIARRFHVKEETLLSANPGKKVRAGAHLKIPTMNGIYVTVGRRDSVPGLARRYGSSSAAIMRANGLEKSRGLRIGMKLFIPGGKIPEERVAVFRPARGRAAVYIPDGGADVGRFRWPCHGRVTSPFGYRRSPFRRRRRVFHAGIDISAPRGTPVVASASGVVVRSGWMSGYGKTVVIQHSSGVSTLYGHNSSLLVGVGTAVSRGQIIARVGSTGRSTGNHCHFEIRYGGRPTNPMRGLR